MNKLLLGICCAWFLTSSCQSEGKSEPLDEEISIGQEWIAHLATGSDTYQTDRVGDTTIYKYPDLIVKVVEKYEIPGEYIQLISPQSEKEINEENAYFLGKVGKYLLVDAGTSSVRTISIYDQETLEVVHNGVSYRDIHIAHLKIFYKTKIDLAESDKKPECSPELKSMDANLLGFLQTVYFDLNTLEYQTTTQVECAYFE